MNRLVEIVGKINTDEIVLNSNSKEDFLLSAILNHEVLTDKEAMELLNVSREYYYELRRKAYNKLVDHFILNFKKGDTFSERYIFLYKQFAIFHALYFRGYKKLAVEFGEGLLKECKKYDNLDLILGLLKRLNAFYTQFGSKYKAKKIFEEIRYYAQEQYQENIIESLFGELALIIGNKTDFNQAEWEQINQIEFETLAIKAPNSIRAIFLKGEILSLIAEIRNDLDEIIDTCEASIQGLDKKDKHIPYAFISLPYLAMVKALIKKGLYEEAFEVIQKAKSLVVDKGRNLFVLQMFEVYCHFYSNDIDGAISCLDTIRKLKKLSEKDKEWILLSRSLADIITSKKIRLWRNINSMPIFEKDKSGMNVNLFTVRILYYIANQQYGEIIELRDALQNYINRHLNKKSLFRLRNWIQFVLLCEKSHFKRFTTEIKAKKQIHILCNTSIEDTPTTIEQEPIPYRYLVHWVLGQLD